MGATPPRGDGNYATERTVWHTTTTTPTVHAVTPERNTKGITRGNRRDATLRRGWNITLAPIIIEGSCGTAPGDHTAVLERQAVKITGGNRRDATRRRGGHRTLAISPILLTAPGDHTAVLDRQTVAGPRRNRRDATLRRGGHRDRAVVVVAPGDDLAGTPERQAVDLTGRDRNHVTQPWGNIELTINVPAPADYIARGYVLGLGRLDQPQAEGNHQQQRQAAADPKIETVGVLHRVFPF